MSHKFFPYIPAQNGVASGYYDTLCCLCEKKPLYRCGGKGYCKDHKHVAVAHRKYVNTTIYEPVDKAFEVVVAERDRREKKRQSVGPSKTRQTAVGLKGGR